MSNHPTISTTTKEKKQILKLQVKKNQKNL